MTSANQHRVNRVVCMLCGKGPPTHDMSLHRINVTGEPGVWACPDHARDALKMFYRQFGKDRVHERLHKHLAKEDATTDMA